jgi:DNA (cytosine-5)-methyltransferase 1
MENEIFTIAQTAEYLQVSEKTVRRLIKFGQITASKVGERNWRIRKQDIEEYLAKNSNKEMTTDEEK